MQFQHIRHRLHKFFVVFGDVFFVDGVALEQVLFESFGRPNAKLGGLFGIDPIANR